MRWPWKRREERGASPATLAAARRAEVAQRRLQRAREETQHVEAAADRVAELPAGELVRRLGIAFAPRREHD